MGDYQRKPGSPLAAAGARRGDQIIFDRDRHQMRAIGVGETVGVTLFVQAAQPRHVVVRAQRDTAVSFIDRLAEAAGLFALRGQLVGVVLLGERSHGESFRRDEIDLLSQSACQLGLELEMRRLEALEARVLELRPPVPRAEG